MTAVAFKLALLLKLQEKFDKERWFHRTFWHRSGSRYGEQSLGALLELRKIIRMIEERPTT